MHIVRTTRLTVGLMAFFFLLSLTSEGASQTKKKLKKLAQKVSELEEELPLLRDLTGDASDKATKVKKKLGEISSLVSKLSDSTASLTKSNAKIIKFSNALGKKAKANTAELAKLAAELKAEIEKLRAEKVTFKGQVRIRPQFRNNHMDFTSWLDSDQDLFVSHRIRLGARFSPSENVDGYFEFQDARRFGAPSTAEDHSSFAVLHQGYLSFGFENVEIMAGRKEWDFGSGKVIGKGDWGQAGQAFDGVDIKLTKGDYITADILFAILDENNTTGGTDSLVGGFYASSKVLKPAILDFYYIYTTMPGMNHERNFSTVGIRASGAMPNHEALIFDLEGNVQFGTVFENSPQGQDGKDNPHFATAYHAMLGYKLPVDLDPVLKLFFNAASGDGNSSVTDPGNDSHTAYIPLFGSKHSILGQMDIFSLSNIWEIGGRIEMKPLEGLQLGLQYQMLNLVDEYGQLSNGFANGYDGLTPSSMDIGNEIDFSVGYSLSKNLILSGGYSIFLPGNAVKDQVTVLSTCPEEEAYGDSVNCEYGSGDIAQWLWLQADLKF